ncbi:MAG: hypothetical protein PHQ89_01165 [Bacilli bacterium]|nr:hypothetical protein [Bacilli bacterium]
MLKEKDILVSNLKRRFKLYEEDLSWHPYSFTISKGKKREITGQQTFNNIKQSAEYYQYPYNLLTPLKTYTYLNLTPADVMKISVMKLLPRTIILLEELNNICEDKENRLKYLDLYKEVLETTKFLLILSQADENKYNIKYCHTFEQAKIFEEQYIKLENNVKILKRNEL